MAEEGRAATALESLPGRRHALTLAVAAAVFMLALDGGTYALTSRTSVAIGIWWVLGLAVALSVWPLVQPPTAALVTGALLTAFALCTALSITWADSAERAFAELDRVLLYLGAFGLAVVAGAPGNARRWRDGIALGLTAVGLLALSSRLFGDLVGNRDLFRYLPNASEPLSYPVNYRNGLGILIALAFPLLLGAAADRGRPLLRAVALAPFPALIAVIYLTSSRGGAGVAAVGTLLFVALTSRRAAAAGAVLCASAGGAAVIGVLSARPELVDGPLDSAAASSQGESAALLIGLACIGSAAMYGIGCRFARWPTFRARRRARRVLTVAGIVAVTAGVVAVDPGERFETFKAPPDPEAVPGGAGYTTAHLASGGGSGRWQFWEAAVDEFRTDPVLGGGAGSYEAWWAQHGTLPYFIRDAHSLYLETLAELGVVGLCLLLAALGSGIVVAITRMRTASEEQRGTIASLAATFAAFALAAGYDWMWELTVVAVVGFVCLGLLVGPASANAPQPSQTRGLSAARGRRGAALRTAAVLTGLAIIVAQAIPMLSRNQIQQSREAVERGDGASAVEHALAARKLQGWAASPHLQLALVEEQTGDVTAARASIARAIERDRADWRLWLVSARLETKAGRVAAANASLRQAERLNPRSPLFAAP